MPPALKAGPPKPMPAIGKTTVFPRVDTAYKGKESLPYDEAQTLVWKERPTEPHKETCREFVLYIVMGIIIGTVAFIMKTVEEKLILLFYNLT